LTQAVTERGPIQFSFHKAASRSAFNSVKKLGLDQTTLNKKFANFFEESLGINNGKISQSFMIN
jgi:hypothetical protein